MSSNSAPTEKTGKLAVTDRDLEERKTCGKTMTKKPYRSPFFPTQSKKRELFPFSIEYYSEITDRVLDTFYPLHCPVCQQKMAGRIKTRPYVGKCLKCRVSGSKISGTPFYHLKLPYWTIGWVLDQSAAKYPQVLTGAEIQRQLNITESAALRLKKRVQVFASEQKEAVERLFYKELQTRFQDKEDLLEQDTTDINKRVDLPVLGLPIPQTDTVVLFSAKERSNKGRKRFRHHGQTASIYQCDSLGGRQIGTMVQTTTWKGGPALYESIPNQQVKTLLPIIQKQIPKNVPLFTDMGMDWFKPFNRNHRTVNHNLPSKRGKGKSRRRFQQNGVHTQAAEGRQGALKSAFRAYRYFKPEHSQLYLNEFTFFSALGYFGPERIGMELYQSNGLPRQLHPENAGCGKAGMNVRQSSSGKHPIPIKFLYRSPSLDDRKQLSPRARVLAANRQLMESGQISSQLREALLSFEAFHTGPTISHRRRREKEYAHLATRLWSLCSSEDYTELATVCRDHGLNKRACHRIIARWNYLGLAQVVDRTHFSRDSKEYLFDVRLLVQTLPAVLYMAAGEKAHQNVQEWRRSIVSSYSRANEEIQPARRKYEQQWINN